MQHTLTVTNLSASVFFFSVTITSFICTLSVKRIITSPEQTRSTAPASTPHKAHLKKKITGLLDAKRREMQ